MAQRKDTKQLNAWMTDFGNAYTNRNLMPPEAMDRELEEYYGVKKSTLFHEFLPPSLISSGRILEVGCNVGLQLRILHFANPELELWGIEPNTYALANARKLDAGVNYLPGNAFDLPFKDGFFDIVMTNGVLIHIGPSDMHNALSEIYRCSSRFIFFHEYFSDQPQQVLYNGKEGLLWKMNYKERYLDLFPSLVCVKERYLYYKDPATGQELIDQICLLRKG